ncbi:MAG: phosphotyrosine protein phosphatase [Proteobacteria bacterium]|nr:phosphotyrosine protein phosphatase [Pseudomonadota bacterium]
MSRLVFVCRGNICRSPYGGLRASSLGVRAVSFGLDAAEGAPANPVASRNALLRGVDLSAHCSARLETDRLSDGDLVLVFEPAQLAEVRRRLGDRTAVGLLGVWARPRRPHIQDPYGRSDRYFQQCFAVIDASIDALMGDMARAGAPAIMGERAGARSPSGRDGNSCDQAIG